jgi:hypothetical protein
MFLLCINNCFLLTLIIFGFNKLYLYLHGIRSDHKKSNLKRSLSSRIRRSFRKITLNKADKRHYYFIYFKISFSTKKAKFESTTHSKTIFLKETNYIRLKFEMITIPD